MKNTTLRFLMAVAVAFALAVVDARAQMSETDALQQLRADIQADRQAVVAANLKLTDAEGAAFWPVYREYRGELAKVGDRLQKLIQDYARVYDTATPEQAKALVDEMLAIERATLTAKETNLPKLRKVLPEVKVARFLQIEGELDAVLRLGLAADMPLIGTTK
jgi:septum formation topological specificity factor MinE